MEQPYEETWTTRNAQEITECWGIAVHHGAVVLGTNPPQTTRYEVRHLILLVSVHREISLHAFPTRVNPSSSRTNHVKYEAAIELYRKLFIARTHDR